jgi:RNA polymerase sigma-70 factor (ECF subfamily)
MNATTLLLVDRRMQGAAALPSRDPPPEAAAAFTRLLEKAWRDCEPRLARLAIGLGLRSDEAADVLQDVYVAAIQKPPPITTDSELSRWLFQVTINRCHLEHRQRTRRRRLWHLLVAAWRGERCSDQHSFYGELKAEVARALTKLTDLDRSLVVMRYFTGLNSREIGQIMNLPEATVRGRLRAARLKLAEDLSDWNDHE